MPSTSPGDGTQTAAPPALVRRFHALSRWLGLGVALVGAWHLAAWLEGGFAQRGLVTVTIKTNATLCLLLLGTALAIDVSGDGRHAWIARPIGTALALAASLVGGLTLLENLLALDFGIDQLIATEPPGALGVVSPNRMGSPAALGALLGGVALAALARRPPWAVAAQYLGLAVTAVGLLATMGYLYDVPAFYGIVRVTAIAWPTALSLLALGAAVLAARPAEGLMARVTADDPGGHLFRRLLAPTLLVPLVMGWFRLLGERRGLFDPSVGTGLVMLFFMVAFTALLLAGARRVNRWANALHETQRERERLHATIAEDRERLRTSNDRLHSMFESAAAGIAEVDLQTGRFLRVNRQFSVMTGYAPDALLGMRLQDVTHPDDRPAVEQGLARGRTGEVTGGYYAERRYICADGREIEVELHASALRDADGRPSDALVVVIDVTARKRAERELEAARRAAERARGVAEEANRAKDHFLSILSHELRTPLSPVLTGLVLMERQPLSPEAVRVLDVIRRNVELEARLIDDLLDLTRIARGKVELDRRRRELCTIIERAVEVCQADIAARGLHVGVDYGPRPYIVDADGARLQQVFWNLLKNAVKFTPKDGCVGVRCRPDDGEVVVEVTDSGIGIEPSALESIFDAFAQAERSITRQFGGLGLGLAISRALVELHGGRIEARSEGPGRGATFAVRLPMVALGEQAAAAAAPPRPRALPPARSLRILLVEDHGDTAELMVAMLGLAGHSVEAAGDVATALETAARRDIDIVVSDLGLPDRSGLDLIRELRSGGNLVPAIALSGYGQEADVEKSREAGFAAHLVKPAEPDLLLETIERVANGTPG